MRRERIEDLLESLQNLRLQEDRVIQQIRSELGVEDTQPAPKPSPTATPSGALDDEGALDGFDALDGCGALDGWGALDARQFRC